ncbi:MAG: hypothetical protein ABI614_00815 [Planctomycetota bacterium]
MSKAQFEHSVKSRGGTWSKAAAADVFFQDDPVLGDLDVALTTDQHQSAVGAEVAVPGDQLLVAPSRSAGSDVLV